MPYRITTSVRQMEGCKWLTRLGAGPTGIRRKVCTLHQGGHGEAGNLQDRRVGQGEAHSLRDHQEGQEEVGTLQDRREGEDNPQGHQEVETRNLQMAFGYIECSKIVVERGGNAYGEGKLKHAVNINLNGHRHIHTRIHLERPEAAESRHGVVVHELVVAGRSTL
jgi:hypothetical protein